MKTIKTKLIFSTLLLFVTSNVNAAVYNLVDFPLFFNESTSLVGTLETSQTGVFSSESEIENFLNSSTYSVIFSNGIDQLFSLNNSNSAWDLEFGFELGSQTTSASLMADSQAITIDFSTPLETTEARLFLRSPTAFIGYIQYAQYNNVSDGNFFGADYNAISRVGADFEYDSAFVLGATNPSTVPVPPAVFLFASALGLFGFARRRNVV